MMMSWNYRMIRHAPKDGDEGWVGIHEVYYNEDLEPIAWTEDTADVFTTADDPVAGFHWLIEKFTEAAAKPLLEIEDEKLVPGQG